MTAKRRLRKDVSSSHAPLSVRTRWLVLSLAGSGLLSALLLLLATQWRVPTFISLEVVTERVSFVVRDADQVLDLGVDFSSLAIEQCAQATFEGVELGSAGGSGSAPTRLMCRDPDAKIAFVHDGGPLVRLGSVGTIGLNAGTAVALRVAGRVLTLELSGQPLTFDVPLERDLAVVADLVEVEPAAPGIPGLVRYTGTLVDAPRNLARLETSDRGAVLMLTLANQTLSAFDSRARIPVKSVRFDTEGFGGVAVTALREDAVLSYPDYASVTKLIVPKDNAVLLDEIEEAHIRALRLERIESSEQRGLVAAIKLTLDGSLVRGTVGTGDRGRPGDPSRGRWVDPRLTMYDVLTQGRWRLAAVAATWTVATVWAAYQGLRQLST